MFSPDPKPEPRKKGDKEEREKKYTCKFCKEKYSMLPSVYAKRSMTGFKRCCEAYKCQCMAVDKLFDDKRKAAKKDWNKRKKEEKVKSKNLTNWKDDLQKVVNWIVRKIDEGKPCISHPQHRHNLRMDAGHYYSVATSGDLRFNLHNIHAQGSSANERHGGGPDYLNGLSKRYGQDYADYVQYKLGRIYKGIAKEKIRISDIKELYLPNARRVKREMEKGADFTRDQVNTLIGIYTIEYSGEI
jgi:hypothetical protein